MSRYLTSYRFYTLAKIGFSLAYLWYVWDFFWIHVALWNQLNLLLANTFNSAFSGIPALDVFLYQVAIFLNEKAVVWMLALMSPLVVCLYLWGRHRWLQFAVGCWMSASMICLTASIAVFHTTADIWVNFVFIIYALTGLITSNDDWESSEPGFTLAKWRDDPVVASTYAWFVVWLQFTVYFFAGVNKLADGWVPWTTGVAIQNLMAFDNSVHEFARGVHVPYWISLILCYVTLLQRLVVPFGFFFKRSRIWSVLILGAMHVGYAILMYVNLFPLIGISCLLMVLPPRAIPMPRAGHQRVKNDRLSRQMRKKPPTESPNYLRTRHRDLPFFFILALGLHAAHQLYPHALGKYPPSGPFLADVFGRGSVTRRGMAAHLGHPSRKSRCD